MTICSITRPLIAAWVVGFLATALTQSDPIGWIVAVIVGGIAYLAQSRYPRLGGGSCAIPERSKKVS